MFELDSTRRFRHELKFVIHVDVAEKLFEELSLHTEFDEHADKMGMYEIASLYYDTEDLRFYWDREESVGYRRKVRVRSYNSAKRSQALFLEVKEKHKHMVSKKRLNFSSTAVLEEFTEQNRMPLERLLQRLPDSADRREINYLHRRLELLPMTIVRYIRKAYVTKFERDLRLTFDTRLTAGGCSLECYVPDEEKAILRHDYGVFELKSNQSVPLWLQSVLKRNQLTQQRCSKYALAVRALYNRPGRALGRLEEALPPELQQVA